MAKTVITGPDQEGSTPFLRGILTRSLQNAGLPFDQAYELASAIRDEMSDRPEVSRDELRQVVTAHLEEFGDEYVERYQASRRPPGTILVMQDDESATPFSRAQLRRHLEACGLAGEPAAETTRRVFESLVTSGVKEISSGALGMQVYEDLEREIGPDIARRHLVWTDFTHSDRPLLLLIGGAPGCGKSTVATEIAHRLEIVRTQSTDMLREVMRMMVPERLLPALHTSSFTAWQTLPQRDRSAADREGLIEDGYRSQAWLLSVACEAVLRRALTERVSLILEGVHVQPTLADTIPEDSDAVVISIVLAVLRPKTLRKRLRGRGRLLAARRAERYLDHFGEIWQLQSHILSEADRHGVPIIPNTALEDVVQHVITLIINALEKEFSATPEQVFLESGG